MSRHSWMARRGSAGGFTLLELAVVLGVIAILISAVAPNFIEGARDKMAERAMNEIRLVQDALLNAYVLSVQTGPTTFDPTLGAWPGETAPGSCVLGGPTAARDALIAGAFLPMPAFTGPWGSPYDLTLAVDPTLGPRRCTMTIATDVPSQLVNTMASGLAQTICGPACGGAPAGNVRCCTRVSRPSADAPLSIFRPGMTPDMCTMLGGTYTYNPNPAGASGTCQMDGTSDLDDPTCVSVAGVCPPGTQLGNVECNDPGKGCGSVWSHCCATTN